jgi:hypothetical protein
MIRKLLCVSVVLLVAVAALLAADAVTGKWTYEQPMGMGRGGGGGGGVPPGGGGGVAPGGGGGGGNMPPRVVTMDLKADGAKLTGTVLMPAFGGRRGGGGGGGEAPPAPTPVQITNGKVDGNNISFEVTRDMGGNSMTTKYEGAVSGSDMKLKVTSPGFNGGDPRVSEVTAKKQ